MSEPFHSGGLRGAAKVGAKKGEELKEIYRKAKSAPVPQNELLEAALNAVPTNWCDSLLSGDNVPPLPWGCPEIERLLNSVRLRIATIIRNAEQGGGG